MEAGLANAAKRLHPYLRALWMRELRLHPYDRPLQQQRPYLSELGIHLPPSWHAGQGSQAFALYRAAGFLDVETIEVHEGVQSSVLVWQAPRLHVVTDRGSR